MRFRREPETASTVPPLPDDRTCPLDYHRTVGDARPPAEESVGRPSQLRLFLWLSRGAFGLAGIIVLSQFVVLARHRPPQTGLFAAAYVLAGLVAMLLRALHKPDVRRRMETRRWAVAIAGALLLEGFAVLFEALTT